MEYKNATIFPSLAFESVDGQGNEFYVAVLRVTHGIEPDGHLSLAPVQTPLLMTDEWYGELNKSSVKQESDLAPFKPWCDVNVIGSAEAPAGRPAARFEAGLRMTRKEQTLVDKRLVVTGPRYWQKRLVGGWALTNPEPIRSLPLRYEFAYGGECRIESGDPAARTIKEKYCLTAEERAQHPEGADQAPAAHVCSRANNVGRGFMEPWYRRAKKLRRFPAPQIESPLDPIVEFGKAYMPQGLGVIGRAWNSRLSLCGTMDKAFLDSGRPLPEDFDYAYWNGAHPDLQLPWLQGGETIDLVNIPLAGRHESRSDSQGNRIARLFLPDHRFCGVTILKDGQMGSYDLNLDTLVIDAEKGIVHLTYRLKLPVNPAMESLEVEQLSDPEKDILKEHVGSVNERIRLYQAAAQ